MSAQILVFGIMGWVGCPYEIYGMLNKNTNVRITCPMAKFTKFPHGSKKSVTAHVPDLFYTDICAPYSLPTKDKFRCFLTMVDDHKDPNDIFCNINQSIDTS